MNNLQLRKAERRQAKMRVGISGPSGSGKTYSALLLASGMTDWSKIALIDTENGSGELYADLGDYNVITLSAPFSPSRYVEAIKACENAGMEVIIIDSATHEWDGDGGCLDIHSKMAGNSFTNWSKITPMHNSFIQAILQSKCHIITTTRRKQDYDMTQNNGKTTVTKVGLKEIQRDGFEYELTLSFDIDIAHFAQAGKDRTGLFMDKPAFRITKETGKVILDWASSGKEAIKIEYEPTETKDPVSTPLLDKLKAKADLKTINKVCGLNLKKIEHITQAQATQCLILLMQHKND